MENKRNSLLQLLISILICLLLFILTINIFSINIDPRIAIYIRIALTTLTVASILYAVYSFCSLFESSPIDNVINFIAHKKTKALIILFILLAILSLTPLVPMIFRGLIGYHVNFDVIIQTVFWVFLAASILFSIGAVIKPRKYAVPIFIGATALMPIASLFVISNHSSDISWALIQLLILTTWIMLHIQYCMPVSNAARAAISILILLIGIPATALAIFWSGFGHAFNSSTGMPPSKGAVFFPLVILGPFILICIIRKLFKLPSPLKNQADNIS